MTPTPKPETLLALVERLDDWHSYMKRLADIDKCFCDICSEWHRPSAAIRALWSACELATRFDGNGNEDRIVALLARLDAPK